MHGFSDDSKPVSGRGFLVQFLLLLPGALLAPIIHEWVKAMTSTALGDPTPRNAGYLNPLKCFEPIGFFFMLSFHVGWGRPVPTSPLHYKDRRMGTILVQIVPILTNLLIGMLTVFALQFMPIGNVFVAVAIFNFAQMNVGLAVFSLLPIHPMGGSKLIQMFVSPTTAMSLTHREKMLQVVMIFLLMFNILQMLIFPVRDFFLRLVI